MQLPSPLRRRRRVATRRAVIALLTASVGAVALPQVALASLPGASSQLTRAPYLSDLTASSVRVSWATTTQTHGIVKYGPAGSCGTKSVTSSTLGNPITVKSTTEYNNSVTLTGLSSGGKYCYRVYSGSTDLLGSNATPYFTTLNSAGSTSPVTFVVFGDWGDTTNHGSNTGSTNVNQAALHKAIAASGARFAITTGDTAYPGGTQTSYGDLNQTGVDVSAVFGPSYWAKPGQVVPMFMASGNHGRNANFLNIWPEGATASASKGVYAMTSYPSIDGATAASYPTSYYAFTANGARFYVLDAAWSDSNVGSATGGACGSHCKIYQVDHDAHWLTSSAEYKWLKADLAAHPGGVKLAFFHFPLRSDDPSEPDNNYLNVAAGSTGLEGLLAANGVKLAFNGHAHIYQRNTAPSGGLVSYVTGGGGARLSTVSGCASTDAYAIGWSYSSNKGSKCGSAPTPTSDAQVFHFLKVTISGKTVTVTPTNAAGGTFDVKSYTY